MFPSSIWLQRDRENKFMFETMLKITKSMSEKIDGSMDSIYQHLQTHQEWDKLKAIKNQEVVQRQDDERVGQLLDKGIRNIAETKEQQEDDKDLSTFIDSNLAVNILSSTAKKINAEFQGRIRAVMSRFGDFREGPGKTVERCQSKLENDYQKAAYPKAAKLLDVVRCAVSFNTVEQLLAGYDGLMRHINTNTSSLELARVKNGFTDKQAAFRDIKVNVVYHSETDLENETSLICEVQLMLNQYLHEKKRIHKLYSILRERTFFEMVVLEEGKTNGPTKDIKTLQFEPLLNVKEHVKLSYTETYFHKCSVNSDLGLLGMTCDGGEQFFCVKMDSKNVVFQCPSLGYNTHHWVVHQGKSYLSLQTKESEIKMFAANSFAEDVALSISLPATESINYTEFDSSFENIFILKNFQQLEQRTIADVQNVKLSIKLKEEVEDPGLKQLVLSNDGTFCAIGGGFIQSYFYLIDLTSKTQHKITSKALKKSLAPCFINGDAYIVAVGGGTGDGVEIWDVQQKQFLRVLQIKGQNIGCSASTNNIFSVGTYDGKLILWDVRNWERFFSKEFSGMIAASIHLTSDSKYLTIGGVGGDKCVVLEIQ